MNPCPCPVCRRPLPTGSSSCSYCAPTSPSVSRTLAISAEKQSQARAAAAPPATSLPPRLGPYSIVRELGRGGMGRVLEAVDEPLGRHVAVKMLLAAPTEKSSNRRRFIEEARITGCLEHPGIAPIYSLGKAPDGSEYFSMKLVSGRNLNDILRDRQNGDRDTLRLYPLPRLLSIFERVVETIAYAHAQGILHRDLKPANIMVGAHGEVWVLDWGLAKALSRNEPEPVAPPPIKPGTAGPDPELTVPGAHIGTPQYMAPEQAKGHRLDVRTDVFGLGGILYKVLTGQSPNKGADYLGTMMAAALGEIAAVRSTRGGRRAPVKLAAIAQKCLAARPENRYVSAEAVLADVRAYATGDAIAARPDGVLGKLWRLARRHRVAAVVLGMTFVLLLLGSSAVSAIIAAKDRRALEAEREVRILDEKARASDKARVAAEAETSARAQRRLRAFKPYSEANELLLRGQLPERAAKLLEDALQIDPEFPEAQFALGEALRLTGVPARAAQAYMKANELSRKISGQPHLQALLAAGLAFDGAGDYANSEQCFQAAEREGAGHPLALVGKALRLAHAQHWKEARKVAEDAQRKAPHLWETHFTCGYILHELVKHGFVPPEPNTGQSVALLRKSLELSPRQAEACAWLAISLGPSATPEARAEADRLFDHAVALEPKNGNRYIFRGIHRYDHGDVPGGTADFQKARELQAARPLLLYADALIAVRRGDDATAYRLSGELLRETHDWPPHVGNWVALGFRLKRDQEVRAKFEEWCRRNPDYPEVYVLRAQLRVRSRDVAGAIADDRAGLTVAPYNRRLRTQLAIHLSMTSQWKEALAAADAALELSANDFLPQAIRARCLGELGRGAEAKALLDRLQKDFPGQAKDIDDVRRSLGDRLPK